MGLEVYYPTDIENALRAAEQACEAALQVASSDAVADAYRAGYRAALTTIALAFGMIPQLNALPHDWLLAALERKVP